MRGRRLLIGPFGKDWIIVRGQGVHSVQGGEEQCQNILSGLLDSILGLSLWSFASTQTLQPDAFADVTNMVEMSDDFQETGDPDTRGRFAEAQRPLVQRLPRRHGSGSADNDGQTRTWRLERSTAG